MFYILDDNNMVVTTCDVEPVEEEGFTVIESELEASVFDTYKDGVFTARVKGATELEQLLSDACDNKFDELCATEFGAVESNAKQERKRSVYERAKAGAFTKAVNKSVKDDYEQKLLKKDGFTDVIELAHALASKRLGDGGEVVIGKVATITTATTLADIDTLFDTE